MKYKEYKKQLESIKYSKNQIKYKKITTANGNAFDQYDNDCDFERNLQMENNLKRRYYKQEDAKDSFSSCYAKKTNRQNSAFHSAVVQLLPQYNEYLANHGADRFGKLVYNEDTFKEALKVEAGYFREIKKEEALIYVKMNRQELKKLLPNATVEELVDARLRQKEIGRIRDATKEQMIDILKAIEIWAIDKGFSLCIEKELMDLIK
jgi:dsDNA-binding SOS-regulon protein|tara:strand:- start:143 stop:763 length:621 start_codon:yes stop_codon:yes gene_type:complete